MVDSAREAEDLDTAWQGVRLRTTMTDPPRHELILQSGTVVRLETPDFFSMMRFSVRFLDATGSFPPFPEKNGSKFLRNLTTQWFASRETVVSSEEAGDRGILLSDIRSFILSAPESDSGLDLERGAIVRNKSGGLFSARTLLDRVIRSCPFKVKASDFFAALSYLGCTNQEVIRIPPWRGRCWLAPAHLLSELPDTPKPVTPVTANGKGHTTLPL